MSADPVAQPSPEAFVLLRGKVVISIPLQEDDSTLLLLFPFIVDTKTQKTDLPRYSASPVSLFYKTSLESRSPISDTLEKLYLTRALILLRSYLGKDSKEYLYYENRRMTLENQ